MWTLENTVSVPWTPRSECLVQQEKATDSEPDDVTLMQVIVPALIPFPEAKRAVTEALARFLGPYEGGRGDGP